MDLNDNTHLKELSNHYLMKGLVDLSQRASINKRLDFNCEICDLALDWPLYSHQIPKESVQMTVIPVYDTYDEPYVVKGLFGQRCVSWLLAN